MSRRPNWARIISEALALIALISTLILVVILLTEMEWSP